mmetsp:Transcript_7199/g.23761  ORF Transcript_7199/g.23761 Transcript_7199/m.23761 type:complete len:236 (+) Transcript_7199:584-1291(+)
MVWPHEGVAERCGDERGHLASGRRIDGAALVQIEPRSVPHRGGDHTQRCLDEEGGHVLDRPVSGPPFPLGSAHHQLDRNLLKRRKGRVQDEACDTRVPRANHDGGGRAHAASPQRDGSDTSALAQPGDDVLHILTLKVAEGDVVAVRLAAASKVKGEERRATREHEGGDRHRLAAAGCIPVQEDDGGKAGCLSELGAAAPEAAAQFEPAPIRRRYVVPNEVNAAVPKLAWAKVTD